MGTTVNQLKWIIKNHHEKDEHTTAKELEDAYDFQLEGEGNAEVIPRWKDRVAFTEILKSCPVVAPDRYTWGPPPEAEFHGAVPVPVDQPSSSISGQCLAFVKTQNVLPPERQLPTNPGPAYDLAIARSLQQSNRETTIANFGMIFAAFRQSQTQREEAEAAGKERRKQEWPGALKMVNADQKEEISEWLAARKGGDLGDGRPPVENLRCVVGNSSNTHGNWLNDDIIDYFFKLLQEFAPHRQQKVWSIPQIAAHFLRRGTEDIDRRAQRDSFNRITWRNFDYILLPWIQDSHWMLLIADTARQQVRMWNSLEGVPEDMGPTRLLANWLGNTTETQWTTASGSGPWQGDSDMCGVLVCYNAARYIFRGKDSTLKKVSRAEARDIRLWLLLAIMNGSLSADLMKKLS